MLQRISFEDPKPANAVHIRQNRFSAFVQSVGAFSFPCFINARKINLFQITADKGGQVLRRQTGLKVNDIRLPVLSQNHIPQIAQIQVNETACMQLADNSLHP